MNMADPDQELGLQSVHYFFLRAELAPEVDAFLRRFTGDTGSIPCRRGPYVRVVIANAAKALLFRLFFAGDIIVHLRTVNKATDLPHQPIRMAH